MGYRITSINNINLTPEVPLGVDLSFNNAGIFKTLYFDNDQAKANLKNLLLTRPGERFELVTYGCNLLNILFQPMTNDIKEQINNTIFSSINTWLPYINIGFLEIKTNEDDPTLIHTLRIKLEFSVNGFNTDSITINVNDNSQISIE